MLTFHYRAMSSCAKTRLWHGYMPLSTCPLLQNTHKTPSLQRELYQPPHKVLYIMGQPHILIERIHFVIVTILLLVFIRTSSSLHGRSSQVFFRYFIPQTRFKFTKVDTKQINRSYQKLSAKLPLNWMFKTIFVFHFMVLEVHYCSSYVLQATRF